VEQYMSQVGVLCPLVLLYAHILLLRAVGRSQGTSKG
jgi:hypothetical protein